MDYFDPLQSRILKWAIVFVIFAAVVALVSLLAYFTITNIGEVRNELMPHIVVIIGLAGMGISSLLLVAISRHRDGEIEVVAFGFKFRGGAGPVVLWIMAFLAMVGGSKMLW